MNTPDPRLLATMPLHAITSTYGEDGLRQRFAVEIAGFGDADRERLERALELAGRVHAGDRRQREPYVNHLLRVAIRIIAYYGVRDTDVICAALLHDAVEDHPGELAGAGRGGQHGGGQHGGGQHGGGQHGGGQQAALDVLAGQHGGGQHDGGQHGGGQHGGGQQAALEVLAGQFGPRVAELVGAVTNPEPVPGQDRHQQYLEHVAASLADCPWARVIKASDFTDNGVGLIHTTGARLDRLAAKYEPVVPVLRDLVARPDTPLSEAAKARILGQLDRAAERLAIIRGTGQPG
jgi:hypothetical protein